MLQQRFQLPADCDLVDLPALDAVDAAVVDSQRPEKLDLFVWVALAGQHRLVLQANSLWYAHISALFVDGVLPGFPALHTAARIGEAADDADVVAFLVANLQIVADRAWVCVVIRQSPIR